MCVDGGGGGEVGMCPLKLLLVCHKRLLVRNGKASIIM